MRSISPLVWTKDNLSLPEESVERKSGTIFGGTFLVNCLNLCSYRANLPDTSSELFNQKKPG